MKSIVQQRGPVTFPEYTGERIYMRPFTKRDGLPSDLRRWQPTIDAMLDGIDAPGPIYLMIDQSSVVAGKTQRRPGIHIDGYWNPSIGCHGNGGHHHSPPGQWRSWGPSHMPSPPSEVPAVIPPNRNPVRVEPKPPAKQLPPADSAWSHATYTEAEALILASNVAACRCYSGEWMGDIGEGGDCSTVDVSGLDAIDCEAGVVYAGNVTMLHESLPVRRDCNRTLVRLSVPGWTP